ncbi:hypothetical protein HUU53_00300 [Candidatus Micrarchaeota archaeon]|nr:hypothetical protein [Candidatus Micrarchaeota archaeon]
MIETFVNFDDFKKRAIELGVAVNLDELLSLNIVFLESYEDYVIISVRDYNGTNEPKNNILLLSEKNALLYSENKQFNDNDYKMFRISMQKQYGESSVLSLLTLRAIVKNYQQTFNQIDENIDVIEKGLKAEIVEDATVKLRKLTNRIEDFVILLTSLEERKIKQVNTGLVAYDYDLVYTKAQQLLDRCRNHLSQLRDIQWEIDSKQTKETNKRIEELNLVVKRLTGITIVLMIPNIIAGHFGMNFIYMPELAIEWAYPAVIVGQIIVTLTAALWMKKKGWL